MEGIHQSGASAPTFSCDSEWLTITVADGTTREDAILRQTIVVPTRKVALRGVTLLHDSLFRWGYLDKQLAWVWADDCVVIGDGRFYTGFDVHPLSSEFGRLYLTDCSITDVRQASSGSLLCRGLTITHISDDAFQNVPLVINCSVDDVDPWPLDDSGEVVDTGNHADLWQFGYGDSVNKIDWNIIVYGLRGTGLKYQGLFIRPNVGELERYPDGTCMRSVRPPDVPQLPAEGMALVNVYVEMAPSSYAPVWWDGASDWYRSVNHLLWWNCTFYGTTSNPRGMTIYEDEEFVVDDECNTQNFDFTITNVSVVGCDFARLGGGEPVVDDSGWQHNHFVYPNDGTTKGTQFTTGDDMLNAAGVPRLGSPLLRRFNPDLTVMVDATNYMRTGLADVGAYQSHVGWTRKEPATGPSARKYHAMAYDLDRQTVVLFGGLTAAGDDNQTWEWNGATETWTRMYPYSSPPAQHGHAMVGELSIPTIVGSYGGQMSNWTWDSTLPEWWYWPIIDTPQRERAAAFCELSGLGYLFGGKTPAGQALDDTWIFAQNMHQDPQLYPVPAPRWGHAMETSSFEPEKVPAILFGGEDGQQLLGDTWAFWGGGDPMLRSSMLAAMGQSSSLIETDPIVLGGGGGGGWVQLSPTVSPSARSDARIARDVLFGGYGDLPGGGQGLLGDTWVFVPGDPPTWRKHVLSGPDPRRGHAMVWDGLRNVIVLFGGETAQGPSAETWEFDLGE